MAGHPPFGGKTYAQVIANVLEAPAPSLRSVRPEVSPALEQAVFCCLEKIPSNRFPNVVELAQALAATVDLDSEQSSLLERMVRLQKSPPQSSPRAAEPPRRSSPNQEEATPAFAVVASSRESRAASGPRVDSEVYGVRAEPRRQYLILAISAMATAVVVLLVGLPWLPRFDAKPVAPLASIAASKLASSSPPLAPPVPQLKPMASDTAAPALEDLNRDSPPQSRRPPRPLERATNPISARTSAPQTTPPAAPSSIPPASRKNPLLVGPR